MVPLKILTMCLVAVVLFIEGIQSAALASQNFVDTAKLGLRIVDLKATENYAYVVFQPESAIPKKPASLLEVQIFKGEDVAAAPETTIDLEGPFLDLGTKIAERFEDYTIRVVKKEKEPGEAPVLTAKFKSSPGTPSVVVKPDYIMKDSSKATLHWDAPTEPRGPIDRYIIKHCHRDIITIEDRGSTTTKESELQCEEPKETTRTEIEIDVQRLKRYETSIMACNDIEPEFGNANGNRLCSPPCLVYPANEHQPSGSSAAVVVFIVISVLLSLVIVGYAGYKYYRKNYN